MDIFNKKEKNHNNTDEKKVNDKGKRYDDSYFAVSRRKTRKSMIKILSIGVIVVAAFIAMVVVTGASITSHNEKSLVTHLHPLLNVLVNGKPISVPKNIGIDLSLHKDHSLDQYGAAGGGGGAVAPLHTHDDSGTIHVDISYIVHILGMQHNI